MQIYKKPREKTKNILIIKICIIAREKRKTLFRNNPCFVKGKKKQGTRRYPVFNIELLKISEQSVFQLC